MTCPQQGVQFCKSRKKGIYGIQTNKIIFNIGLLQGKNTDWKDWERMRYGGREIK